MNDREEGGAPDHSDAEDLVQGILRRTSGSVCAAAEDRLPAWADGLLPAVDADLVSGHLAYCARCRALADVLVALRTELPTLAEADPGPAFTESVLAMTSRSARARAGRGARPPLRPRRPGLLADLRELGVSWGRGWAAVMHRPRAALELAYGLSVIFALVAGSPASRVRDVSLEVSALASHVSPPRLVAASAAPENWWEDAGRGVRGLADKAEEKAPPGLIARLTRAWKIAAAKAAALRDHGPVMGQALLHLDLVGVWKEAEFIRQAGVKSTEPAAPAVRPVNDRGMASPGGTGDGPAASKGGTS